MAQASIEEISASRNALNEFDTYRGALGLINENGDLCRDGQRAVSHLVTLTLWLVKEIEADADVDLIADELHEATNRIQHEKESTRD
jgi:hypothetical protein